MAEEKKKKGPPDRGLMLERDKKYRASKNDEYYERNSKGVVTHYDPFEVRNNDPFDMGNPMSLVRLLSPKIRERVLSTGVQSLLSMSEEDLAERVQPTTLLKQIRVSFWNEYEHLHKNFNRATNLTNERASKFIRMERICYGICTALFLREKIIGNDYFLAYICRPPQDYEIMMKESLNHGLTRLREIIDLPMIKTKTKRLRDGTVTETKELDVNVANVVLKTVAFLDLRVKGTIPQQLQIKQQIESRNATVQVNAGTVPSRDLSLEDIDNKLRELTSQTTELLSNPTMHKGEVQTIKESQQNKVVELERSQYATDQSEA